MIEKYYKIERFEVIRLLEDKTNLLDCFNFIGYDEIKDKYINNDGIFAYEECKASGAFRYQFVPYGFYIVKNQIGKIDVISEAYLNDLYTKEDSNEKY